MLVPNFGEQLQPVVGNANNSKSQLKVLLANLDKRAVIMADH
jgi:hypothetical protein